MKNIFVNDEKQLRSGWKIFLAIILPFFVLFVSGMIIGIVLSIAKIVLDVQQ
ncbi:MAG TPA: CPBP family intramembrane metalloprotease domain-containing protein, partial [Clostridium sp.]|nr:CPBP family intramembrane metalloprotease domain-containing protein [Clostridium sp.]